MVKKKGYPRYGENVLCTVTRITPYAAWCTLDEYEDDKGNPIEGMIHISHVANRWVKDIRKHVKQNKRYVAKVVRIDREKGHLNLSLKRVSKFDKRDKLDDFRRGRRASAMLIQAAKRLGKTKKEAEKEIADKFKDYEDLLSAFEDVKENPDVLKEMGVSKKWAEAILEVIEQNFQEKERKIQANLELTLDKEDGVEHLKKALSDLEKAVDGEVKYISAPQYLVEIKTTDPKEGERTMQKEMSKVVKKIEKLGGQGKFEFVR